MVGERTVGGTKTLLKSAARLFCRVSGHARRVSPNAQTKQQNVLTVDRGQSNAGQCGRGLIIEGFGG